MIDLWKYHTANRAVASILLLGFLRFDVKAICAGGVGAQRRNESGPTEYIRFTPNSCDIA